MERNLKELHQLCRLRSTIESFAVARWRERPDRGTVSQERFQPLLEKLRLTAVKGDYPAFHQVDAELHRELILSARLPTLLRCWEAVVNDLDEWITHVQQIYWPSLMSLYREHVLLLEAWDSEDNQIAEDATHQHLEAGWYRIAAAKGTMRHEIDPVNRAASFISTHFASSLDVEWIARNVSFVSASHLTRLFRTKLGISPHAFLKQVRLEKAAETLRSGRDEVAVVARRVGYKNASHFVRDFRRFFGITPLAYRKRRDND